MKQNPKLSFRLPQVIGHRWAAGYAPENTLESIHPAADMGVEWVEFDVKLTKDSVPVLFHDDTLERTTNGSGPMAGISWAELQQLEGGSWFSPTFAGVKIPSLEDALDVVIARGLGLNIEIKPCPGREIETAEAALDVLASVWDDHARLLISSFSHVSLETALDMAPDWNRGLLLESEWPENWAELADYLKVTTLNIDGNACTRAQVREMLEISKRPLLAYTINDPDRARMLQEWGVSGFFSDEPDMIRERILAVH